VSEKTYEFVRNGAYEPNGTMPRERISLIYGSDRCTFGIKGADRCRVRMLSRLLVLAPAGIGPDRILPKYRESHKIRLKAKLSARSANTVVPAAYATNGSLAPPTEPAVF